VTGKPANNGDISGISRTHINAGRRADNGYGVAVVDVNSRQNALRAATRRLAGRHEIAMKKTRRGANGASK